VLPLIFLMSWDLWGRVRLALLPPGKKRKRPLPTTRPPSSAAGGARHGLFELRSADAQKQLLDDTVKAYTDNLQLTLNRFKGGWLPKSDVAQAQTQWTPRAWQDTDVTVQRAQFEHAMAILIGKAARGFSLAAVPLNYQPPSTPIGLPSELLQRRPDIAATERRVAEANQRIGIAALRIFPA